MSTGKPNADDATPDDELRPGALPAGHDRCDRVTLRIPQPTLDAIENLVDAGEYQDLSSAFRAAAYDLVEQHDQEGRR